jgi:leucyl/phenylalanyl-tRNA---protein transferase
VIPWLGRDAPPDAFPPVADALVEPDGLLCAGGDLSPARLLEAYRRGIFPWYSAGQPILWWSPDPRAVLIPDEFKVSRSLAKTVRNRGYTVTINRAFAEVMQRCGDSRLRPEGTWITTDMLQAYLQLHALGYAHSVETWLDGQLHGGLYGLALGQVFFGESMFSAGRDASKVAMHGLVAQLRAQGVAMIDCQVTSAHLESLGARTLPRDEFIARLERLIPDLRPVSGWPAPGGAAVGK